MLAMAKITEILWVAGGALLTAVSVIAVLLWIARERSTPDPTIGQPTLDAPEQDDPGHQPSQANRSASPEHDN
jgi:hypothetical protein